MLRKRLMGRKSKGLEPSMDVLFSNNSDNSQLKIFGPENWPTNGWTPVGIVVVPSSHNRYGDGSCGVMALYPIEQREYDGYAGGNSCGNNVFNTPYAFSTYTTSYIPYQNDLSSNSTTIIGSSADVQWPYDGTYDELTTGASTTYDITIPASTATTGDALADFNGVRNTLANYISLKYDSGINNIWPCDDIWSCAANRSVSVSNTAWHSMTDWQNKNPYWYSTQGVPSFYDIYSDVSVNDINYGTSSSQMPNTGFWYIPAAGELSYVPPKLSEIYWTIKALNKMYGTSGSIDVEEITMSYYTFSSTEYDTRTGNAYIFKMSFSRGLLTREAKSLNGYTRPFMRFIPDDSDKYKNEYLTFVAREQGSFKLTIGSAVSTSILSSVSYSTDDGETWNTTYNQNNSVVTITTPTVNQGDKVLWKGDGIGMSTTTDDSDRQSTSSIFSSTGEFDIEGNIMSLLYGDDFADKDYVANGSSYNFALLFYTYNMQEYAKVVSAKNMIIPIDTIPEYCCYRMFQGKTGETVNSTLVSAPTLIFTEVLNSGFRYMFLRCESLTKAPKLPAATLSDYCYASMFQHCSSLTVAPKLSATTLAEGCYQAMFSNCSSLLIAPKLPATTLAERCYNGMFAGCTSLTSAPVLSATTMAERCYNGMFSGCTSLTTAPELPATTMAERCYSNMFNGCTSLTSAPVLSATTLAEGCYSYMFQFCSSLSTAQSVLPATALTQSCYISMFYDTALVTPPSLPATVLAEDCYQYMFKRCHSLTSAPNLPATTLAYECYMQMFMECTSLTVAPNLSATTLTEECYREMFWGCTSLTTAPIISATTLETNCCYGMFDGCSSLTTAPTLSATTLTQGCYQGMFMNCTSLNSVTCLATSISATDCTSYWMHNVAASGTFTKASSMSSWVTGSNGIPNGWTVMNAT